MFGWFKTEVAVDEKVTKLEGSIKTLKADIASKEALIGSLSSRARSAKEELEDVKLKKKIEEEDIKHMVKIRLEQVEIEKQKALVEMEGKKNDEVARTKDQYRDKLEGQLHKEIERMGAMYTEVLNRLPNITATFSKEEKRR